MGAVTFKEAAAIVGHRSRSTLYRLRDAGHLADYLRPGGKGGALLLETHPAGCPSLLDWVRAIVRPQATGPAMRAEEMALRRQELEERRRWEEVAGTLSDALAAAGLSLRITGPEAAAISEAFQGPPTTRPDPYPFWSEWGRIADPTEPPLPDQERWEHVWHICMGMLGSPPAPPLCGVAELQNLAYQMEEAFQDVDAGVRWDRDRWDDANTRVLLAEVPGCELSAEELRKLLEADRVPAHLKAEVRQALAATFPTPQVQQGPAGRP